MSLSQEDTPPQDKPGRLGKQLRAGGSGGRERSIRPARRPRPRDPPPPPTGPPAPGTPCTPPALPPAPGLPDRPPGTGPPGTGPRDPLHAPDGPPPGTGLGDPLHPPCPPRDRDTLPPRHWPPGPPVPSLCSPPGLAPPPPPGTGPPPHPLGLAPRTLCTPLRNLPGTPCTPPPGTGPQDTLHPLGTSPRDPCIPPGSERQDPLHQPPAGAGPGPHPPPHGELPEGGKDRRGHLRRRLQGPEQGHGRGGGAQEDPPGHGDRGRPQHGHPRDLPAQGAQPPQHRQAARRDPHGEQALPGLRVPAPGPEEVHGLVLHQRHRPAPDQELPVPAAAGPGLLPLPPRPAPRPQAPEPAHQRRGSHQAGRLRPGPRLRGARADVHARGGDPLVPGPRNPAGLQVLLDGRGHLEPGLHLCRDDHQASPVPRRLGDRPALPHLPDAGHPGRGHVAGRHLHARLQAQLPQVGPAGLQQSGAAAGRGGAEAAGSDKCCTTTPTSGSRPSRRWVTPSSATSPGLSPTCACDAAWPQGCRPSCLHLALRALPAPSRSPRDRTGQPPAAQAAPGERGPPSLPARTPPRPPAAEARCWEAPPAPGAAPPRPQPGAQGPSFPSATALRPRAGSEPPGSGAGPRVGPPACSSAACRRARSCPGRACSALAPRRPPSPLPWTSGTYSPSPGDVSGCGAATLGTPSRLGAAHRARLSQRRGGFNPTPSPMYLFPWKQPDLSRAARTQPWGRWGPCGQPGPGQLLPLPCSQPRPGGEGCDQVPGRETSPSSLGARGEAFARVRLRPPGAGGRGRQRLRPQRVLASSSSSAAVSKAGRSSS